VFSSRGGAHTVIVDGRMLLAAGRPQMLDPESVLADCQQRAEALMRRSGLHRYCAPQWPIL
jgi:hypothetical protein